MARGRALYFAVDVAADQFLQIDGRLGIADLAARWNHFFRAAGGEFDELVADDALGADGGNGVIVQLESCSNLGHLGPVPGGEPDGFHPAHFHPGHLHGGPFLRPEILSKVAATW